MYCLKPKLFVIPEDDWFCKACKPTRTSERDAEDDTSTRSAKRRAAAALSRAGRSDGESDAEESAESDAEASADDSNEDAGDANDNEVDAVCFVCTGGGEVLCCDTCTRVYHIECVGLRHAPRGEWSCHECKQSTSKRASRSRGGTRRKASGRQRRRRRYSSSEEESDAEEDEASAEESEDDDDDFDGDEEEVTTGSIKTSGRFHGRSGMIRCEEIWKDLRRHKDAWPFLEPVDANEVGGSVLI